MLSKDLVRALLIGTIVSVIVNLLWFSFAHAQDLSMMRNQTVLVEDTKGLGAGWVYDSTHIMTDNHVVESDVVAIFFFDRDKAVPGVVERRWKDEDVALVKVEVPVSILTPTLRCTKLLYGEPIYIIGMPLGLPWVLSKGYVASEVIKKADDLVVVDAAITHGNSGGPVFDNGGRVIGMSEATAMDDSKKGSPVSLVTPNNTICKLLGKGFK